MSTPLPVVSCGRDAKVAAGIRQMLLPEYDLVHVCESVEIAKADLPALILGQMPSSVLTTTNSTNPGSGNYGERPIAILAGGAYSDADIASIREVIADETSAQNGDKIPWLMPDMSKPYPPPGPEFAALMAKNTKEGLARVVSGEDGKDGGVFRF